MPGLAPSICCRALFVLTFIADELCVVRDIDPRVAKLPKLVSQLVIFEASGVRLACDCLLPRVMYFRRHCTLRSRDASGGRNAKASHLVPRASLASETKFDHLSFDIPECPLPNRQVDARSPAFPGRSPRIEQTITSRDHKGSGQGARRFGMPPPEHAPITVAGIAARATFLPEFGREKAASELEDQWVIWGG
jgi:hypothetical protein